MRGLKRRSFLKLGGGAMASFFLPSARGAVDATDCIVIGAGIAGLAAGDYLRKKGWGVTILEARERVGGRVWSRADWKGKQPVDMGASWIHGISGNPMAELAREQGIRTVPFDYEKKSVYQRGGSRISSAEETRIEKNFRKTLKLANATAEELSQDVSLRKTFTGAETKLGWSAEELARLNFKAHTEIEHEFAASLEELSAQYWNEGEELPGGDAIVPGGLGAIVEPWARGQDIRFGQAVERVRYDRDGVRVKTSQGLEIRAKKLILTVPLGILKKGKIVFDPPLPKEKLDAIGRIGFGNYQKTALLYEELFWDPELHLFDWDGGATGKEWAEWVNLYPFTGEPALIAFHTGKVAYGIESMTDREIADAATDALASALGRKVSRPKDIIVSKWGHDPYSLGAYSFMGVGATPADRMVLGKPSLYFAGEAVSENYSATMHGAYESGLSAAKACLGS
ncbi:MAG: FAD-dependent oxidoreductase [Actinobacteria bacterium]|nr:FAD-dependent oxidoreductase [Actinomycetota bacterium]